MDTRTDPKDGHTREVIALDLKDAHGSFDLLHGDGRLIARINVFQFEDGNGDIDICPLSPEFTLTPIYWFEGKRYNIGDCIPIEAGRGVFGFHIVQS